ncbi:MAG: hypothetical protein ACLFPS_08765 [Clostridia bacterium]
MICPGCRVYLTNKEEICPSCGHVMKKEISSNEKLETNQKRLELNYSGLPISKKVISVPSKSSKRAGFKIFVIFLLLLPIINIFIALYGAFISKDLLIRRLSQIVLVFTFVVIVVFIINVYQYGMEFVFEQLLKFIQNIK